MTDRQKIIRHLRAVSRLTARLERPDPEQAAREVIEAHQVALEAVRQRLRQAQEDYSGMAGRATTLFQENERSKRDNAQLQESIDRSRYQIDQLGQLVRQYQAESA